MAMIFGLLGRSFSRLGAAGKGKFSAGSGSPPNDLKYWFDGLPLDSLANAPTRGMKFWLDGLPVTFIS